MWESGAERQEWQGPLQWGRGSQPASDGFPSPLQVLAFFRFSGLLLGYAVLRLQHWWVIAVRCHLRQLRGLPRSGLV